MPDIDLAKSVASYTGLFGTCGGRIWGVVFADFLIKAQKDRRKLKGLKRPEKAEPEV